MWGRAGTVAAKGTQDSPPAPPPPEIHYKNTSLAVTYCSSKFILQCWNTYGYFFSIVGPSKIYSTHFHQLQRAAVLVSCKKQKAIFFFSHEDPIFLKKEKNLRFRPATLFSGECKGTTMLILWTSGNYVNPTEVETQLHYTNVRFSRM